MSRPVGARGLKHALPAKESLTLSRVPWGSWIETIKFVKKNGELVCLELVWIFNPHSFSL
jgi:hypothetical protein